MFFAGPVGAQESQDFGYDVHGRLIAVHRDTASSSTVTAYGLNSADNRAAREIVLTMAAVWEAEALNHYTGYAQDEGWEANAQQPSSLLIAGPYTATVPSGFRVAVWKMMAGPSSSTAPLVKLDVFDLSNMEVLTEVTLPRSAWRSDWTYQWFELPFMMDSSRAGHVMEFRVHFFPITHVRVDKVGYR
ncbi:hypothetical protein [Brevundimonas sp.]|uniref:hypothetical protein n=1 Tax=Brevundimonas sp. TaxID=1871086 RepID=UPI003D0F6650